MTADDRFYRTELLLGAASMERLRASTVAVFGVGGVGSFTVEALARVGIGRLVLVDHDVVDVTNINRQLHATTKTIGQSKTALMTRRILEINPDARVETIDEFYLPTSDADKFFVADYDCVVDAIDTIGGKIGLAVECERRGIPLVSSMGAGNKLDPTAFRAADIFETTVDPIARVMRKKLKELGIKRLRVVYSTEPPIRLNVEANVEGKTIGSISFVPSVAGLILAAEVVKILVSDSK
ncbi:MAG: tRNA threonylcarbamoyladenosine dehydratase [Selenomonadaceae bacterium]|nr:tRNA threonylcarbamoyladenosine dehydratase [Selenomonadaceae bacterium]